MDARKFEAAVEAANLPGAAAIVVDKEGAIFAHAVGSASTATLAPMALDTKCQIASMTKALVSVAAMQLVEQGKLQLDEPIGALLPDLAEPDILTGFDDAGVPQLRKATRPVTLRHLLTHTAGLGYFFVQSDILRYYMHAGIPQPGERAGVEMPLMFEPGERWEYSVATDWVGFAVEAASGMRLRDYLTSNVLAPLGMNATAFYDTPPDGLASVHVRKPEGGFDISPVFLTNAEFDSGGGGLVSTAQDYARFLRAMLREGELDGTRILKAETVAEMGRNQIGDLRAGYMASSMPELAGAFDNFPDMHTGWGLGFLLNPEPGPNGRAAGSMAWAGIFNSYYWIDPASEKAGVFVTQMSPFGDPGALEAFGALERMAYS